MISKLYSPEESEMRLLLLFHGQQGLLVMDRFCLVLRTPCFLRLLSPAIIISRLNFISILTFHKVNSHSYKQTARMSNPKCAGAVGNQPRLPSWFYLSRYLCLLESSQHREGFSVILRLVAFGFNDFVLPLYLDHPLSQLIFLTATFERVSTQEADEKSLWSVE